LGEGRVRAKNGQHIATHNKLNEGGVYRIEGVFLGHFIENHPVEGLQNAKSVNPPSSRPHPGPLLRGEGIESGIVL